MSAIRYLLEIAYDGAAYDGWQSQPTGKGVQDQVEGALAEILREPIRIEGASRTDAGVHAQAMPAHFDVPEGVNCPPLDALPLAINHHLPDDVRVLTVSEVAEDFHARFDAKGKEYRYRIWNAPVMHPMERHYAWHVPRHLDVNAMQQAANHLLGEHDFRLFTVTCPGELKDSVRILRRCDVMYEGEEVTIVIEANSFLYKMCRVIAGLLMQVGEGKLEADDVTRFLKPDHLPPETRAGVVAPAHGLSLWKVFY